LGGELPLFLVLTMTGGATSDKGPEDFPPTHWSLVLKAGKNDTLRAQAESNSEKD
jgi:hypothetical protein